MKEFICIKPKCSNSYKSEDKEPYYCPECREEKEAVARYIDSKKKPSTRKAPGFEEKMAGFHTMKGITFINLPKKNVQKENN